MFGREIKGLVFAWLADAGNKQVIKLVDGLLEWLREGEFVGLGSKPVEG